MRRLFPAAAALALGALVPLAACRRGEAPPAAEVALYATVGDAPARVVAEAAARRGVARVRRATGIADADVAWLGDPAEAVDLAPRLAAGAAPPLSDVDARWKDAAGRFAPLCARARVLVVRPGAALPLDPGSLRDLADARLAGRVAVPALGDGAWPAAMAALAVAHGEASLGRFLDLLARNRPAIDPLDADVRGRVARGEADVGLVGSEEAAAGALSAAGLEVIVPDQVGRGAVVLPTAVALTPAGAASGSAGALAAFLVGAEAERLLVARVPGFMPLRGEVPVPAGVRPAGNVAALPLDWDALAAERRRLLPRLRAWPAR